ncbi:MAG: hypothetical protein JO106_18380 [Mycobacterium sp.]|nr:hypothetical protein [Mycobacterium sp.]
MSTRKTPPAKARSTPPPKLSPNPSAPSDPSSAGIGSLVCDLAKTINVLEKHVCDMTYPGTDEFNARTLPKHPFDDNAYQVLHDLAERVQQLSDDLYGAEQERRDYAALSPQQQLARTKELEHETKDAQADQAKLAEWQQGASARERAWAVLPPELTAPGRYHHAGGRCGNCGGRIETINGIHRCWACFRRGQDGR